VLLSGGIDSAGALRYSLSKGWDTIALFVDYGQPARRRESEAVRLVSEYFGVRLAQINVSGIQVPDQGEIRGRNAWLVQTALMASHIGAGLIVVGFHSGSPYVDCSEEFASVMDGLVGLQTHGVVKLFAPFLHWSKRDIWNYCSQEQVPINLTYSCERGADQPCRECASCDDVRVLRGYS
jgi:7-cyano-7-deazaguanine synthase